MKADIPGFEKPGSLGGTGRVPDIDATKGSNKRIVEVETPKSLKSDKDQLEAFRRHAGQKPNTKLEIVVTDD